jgi:hypothetical protein
MSIDRRLTPDVLMATQPHNFYKTELSRALRENSFGIKSYQLSPLPDSDSSLALAQAVARVELLEGWVVSLRLTFVGYEVNKLVFID